MRRYTNVRLAGDIVNLTNDLVNVYEESTGRIVRLSPQKHEIPAYPDHTVDRPIVHYILDPKFIEALEAFGRPLDDIVKIYSEQYGRGHIKIAYFAWAKDERKNVYLHKDTNRVNSDNN